MMTLLVQYMHAAPSPQKIPVQNCKLKRWYTYKLVKQNVVLQTGCKRNVDVAMIRQASRALMPPRDP